MRVLDASLALPADVAGTVVTVGTFDGVHRGHVDVIERLTSRSREAGHPSLLVTFDPHPLELVRPDAAPLLLTTREEKLAHLRGTGVDFVAVVPFTKALSELSAEEFVDQVLRERFRLQALLIGHDHGFGRGREGDVDTLRAMGASRGFLVDVVPPVQTDDGENVSSTAIRAALAAGELRGAEAALGRRYEVWGDVVAGEARGRLLGYPTLNVAPRSARKLIPADGVYAVRVHTGQGTFGGMLNVGGRPTFGDERRSIEAHLFDVTADFYGDAVRVGFVARLRDTRRFDGADDLRAQLGHDAEAARAALTLVADPGNLKGFKHFPPSTP